MYDPGLCQHRKYALRTRGVEDLGRRDDVGELADDVRRVRVLVEAGSGDSDQQPAHHWPVARPDLQGAWWKGNV